MDDKKRIAENNALAELFARRNAAQSVKNGAVSIPAKTIAHAEQIASQIDQRGPLDPEPEVISR